MRSKIIIGISLLFLITIVGCKNVNNDKTLEASPLFALPVTFGNGVEGDYLLIGKEGKVGFLVGSGKRGEATTMPIIANQVNKYMWHFWGKENDISGNFKVVGINEDGEEHPILVVANNKVWEYPKLNISPINGADSHTPSQMVFPTSGLWKLEIYFNEVSFDEIVVNVINN